MQVAFTDYPIVVNLNASVKLPFRADRVELSLAVLLFAVPVPCD
jgi:hypothetical protein